LKKILIIFSLINAALYFIIYSYLDFILENLPSLAIPSGAIILIRILFLIAVGFSVGLVVSLIRGYEGIKSSFDYKTFILLSIVPLIMLILSGGQITNFIVTKFFGANKKLSELVFYIFSRYYIWSMWIGVVAGTSIRLRFKRNRQLRITNSWEIK